MRINTQKIVTCLILLTQCTFAGWVEYVDNFDTHSERWTTFKSDENNYARITDGHYVYHANPGNVCWSWPWASGIPYGDFDYELTLKVIPSGPQPFVALVFGLKDVKNFYFWHVTPKNGHYEYGKHMVGMGLTYHRSSDGLRPHHAQIKSRTEMNLKLSRRGQWLKLYEEGIFLESFPYEPFFGSGFGFGLHQDCQEIRVDRIVHRVQEPSLAEEETVRVTGNVSWPSKAGPIKAKVHSSDTASVSTVRKGSNQHLEIEMADLKVVQGQTVGVSLQTTDGATLKVVCEDQPGGRKIHMVTLAGDKETRRKSFNLPVNTQGFVLTLDRKGDQFIGSYNLGSGPQLMGSLKWPKLSTEQTNTCFFGYTGSADLVDTPDHVEMSIKKMNF